MNTNYDSARAALQEILERHGFDAIAPVEALLPADTRYDVCTLVHLAAAINLSGIHAIPLHGRSVHVAVWGALADGHLCIVRGGCHSVAAQQRWMVATGGTWPIVELVAGGWDESVGAPDETHLCDEMIVVISPAGPPSTELSSLLQDLTKPI